jgi:adenine-specific DNA-methyltransferase
MDELNKKLLNTPDLNKERLDALKQLFPDLFTIEGKLNPDELKKIIDPALAAETERFEFKWFGKSGAKRSAFTPSRASLAYDESRSVNPDYAGGNMIIEGENLETLKVLLSAYREKIKCIYIDPPYNTGNDFVYSDNFDESKEDYWEHIGVTQNGVKIDTNNEASGRYHSNWLNMMYPRLLASRQLLRSDGVIFISIDDNEVHHLRKLCDEVFGEENFIADIIWEKRYGRSNDAKLMASQIDHIILYRKSDKVDRLREPRDEKSDEIYSNPDNDPRGDWTSVSFVSQRTKDERPNLAYKIKNPFTNVIIEHPTNSWKYSEEKYFELLNDNRFYWGKDGSQKYPRIKRFLSELSEGMVPVNLWKLQDVGSGDIGTKEVEDLVGKDLFDHPKPTKLIDRIIKICTNSDNDIILDFFAGSGTTAHAVMELNKEDGGNRKFILVQIPELTEEKTEAYKAGYKKISDITIERNKRVIEKLEKEEADKQLSTDESKNQPFKTGFKVYKLSKSNFPRTEFTPDPMKTEEENLADLDKYIEEKEASFNALLDGRNIFDEVLLKNGFTLNYKLEKEGAFKKNNIFRVKDGYKECIICLDTIMDKHTLKDLEPFKETMFICLERALDTTMKWNLKHLMGEKLIAF